MAKKMSGLFARKVTTLFIRDTQVNLLVMTSGRVEKWASLPLEPGMVDQGLIVDEAGVADRIKQIFKESGAQPSKVITALSGHDSLYRIITLPELPDAILPEAIRREAKRTIPTPLEEVYFSYQRIPAPRGETHAENRIFLVTYPHNITDALVRTLRQAGVKPYIMDLAPLALCRIANEPRAIIVNARAEHLDVMVISDRLPQVIRRLSMPGETGSLEENLPLITEEVNRTIAFYNSSHAEKPLGSSVPVFVCGDLAEAPETWQELAGEAGYSVSPLPSPVEAPEGFNPNEFMVNIGLALKELQPEKEDANFSIVNFNALPEVHLPPAFSIARVLVPVGIVIGIGLIILAVILTGNTRTEVESVRRDLAAVQSNVAALSRDINDLNAQIRPAKDTAEALNARALSMERGRARVYLDIDEIIKLANRGDVDLTRVEHRVDTITVIGRTDNLGAIYSYARALRDDSPRFKQVWVSPVIGDDRSWTFTFTVTP